MGMHPLQERSRDAQKLQQPPEALLLSIVAPGNLELPLHLCLRAPQRFPSVKELPKEGSEKIQPGQCGYQNLQVEGWSAEHLWGRRGRRCSCSSEIGLPLDGREKQQRDESRARPPVAPQRACPPSASPGGFKLRSRMKIIRRNSSSGGSERGGGQSAVKFSPRSRMHASIRSPAGVRRTPSRELVSFGRHKLRRLSSTTSRTKGSRSHPELKFQHAACCHRRGIQT
ncbi:hypothetical protein OJAV_G00235980, partial [Oryzias javanicus]